MARMATNESLVSRRKVSMGSERGFGGVLALVLLAVGLFPLLNGEGLRWWAVGGSVTFMLAGFVAPQVLRPLNKLWFRLGLLLHYVTNPAIMFLLYYGAVVPTALGMRAMGKNILPNRKEQNFRTYWITRDSAIPTSMSKQF